MKPTGFAVCAHTFCAHKLIRARSYVVIPQVGIAMVFLLQIRMSWARFRKGVGAGAGVAVLGAGAVSWLSARLRRAAALDGRWCRCRCCQLAKRTGAGVSWLCALWRCRKLAVQAAYILVPASRMSTGRGILCLAIWVFAGVIVILLKQGEHDKSYPSKIPPPKQLTKARSQRQSNPPKQHPSAKAVLA